MLTLVFTGYLARSRMTAVGHQEVAIGVDDQYTVALSNVDNIDLRQPGPVKRLLWHPAATPAGKYSRRFGCVVLPQYPDPIAPEQLHNVV